MDPRWVTDIRDDVKARNVALFFKQWGTFDARGNRVGKHKAGRTLQRRMWNEMPVMLKVEEDQKDLFDNAGIQRQPSMAMA